VFDSWGGTLAFEAFQEFSLRYLKQIADGVKREHEGRRIPLILFSKGCNTQLEALADTGADALGLDWTISLAEARRRVGDKVALQGNLDPAILLSNPEAIRRQVELALESYGPGNGHVFNLGHGITPDVPPEHLGVLIEHLHATSPKYHK
jgi:uroporphyrinogen decarboxylase